VTRLLASLRSRVFVGSVALAVLPILGALHVVSRRAAGRAEEELSRGLSEAVALAHRHHQTRLETLRERARLVADLPKLKAAVAPADPPTVEPLARDYRERIKADLFVVTDRTGRVLVALGAKGSGLVGSGAVASALAGREEQSLYREGDRLLQMVTVPVLIDATPPEVLGTLSLGFALDDALALQFRALTGSEIAFADEGRIHASTLTRTYEPSLLALDAGALPSSIVLGGTDYLALARPLASGGPTAVVLRSREESLRFLRTVQTALTGAAAVAVVVAVLLSYAVARTVTRPLAAVTDAMKELATTGDLTRKIPPGGPGDDEDARLLAHTFNTLTEAIARFQREAALRERLSALGRFSTVIAHEVRNPLMIIRASLRTLRRPGAGADEISEAASDIDHEVSRLDRIVGDVLDFARPPRLVLAGVDLAGLCREAALAVAGGEDRPGVAVEVGDGLEGVVTDAERLRTVLVNLLANACEARGEGPDAGRPGVELVAFRMTPDRFALAVRDRGPGIDPETLPHVFEPYFTTKRTGSGLGLAIAKNLVEALGGTIGASSRPGEGTEMRIELPVRGPVEPSP